MKMEPIIAPVDKELLKAELTEKHFLRDTNHADNKLYIVDNQCAPNVLREIGRLREIAFRQGGGGTGKPRSASAAAASRSCARWTRRLWWPPRTPTTT